MVEERLELEREVKRLRHHVSVLSKRNHLLMKDGRSGGNHPLQVMLPLFQTRRRWSCEEQGERLGLGER